MNRLCGLFGYSRQAYYQRTWQQDDQQMEAAQVLDLVKKWRRGKRRFGVRTLLRRMRSDLQKRGLKIGRDRLFDLLREHNMLIRPRRKYVRTTQSSHHFRKWPNRLKGLEIYQSEQVWVSDITYIATQRGYMYLFLITDAYSRKIMGYHLSHRLQAKGAVAALRMALKQRQFPERALIHHSDRGIQYCSTNYIKALQAAGIAISMTEKASPDHNALAERINRTLKEQFGMDQGFADHREALQHLVEDVQIYNHVRPHSSCGGLTPAEAHRTTQKLKQQWQKQPQPTGKGGGADALHTTRQV